MAHRSRLSKEIRLDRKQTDAVYAPDLNAPTMQDWLTLVPKINKCGAEMEMLMQKWGMVVFGINLSIYTEYMPGHIVQQIERLRYQSTKMQEKAYTSSKNVSSHFKL